MEETLNINSNFQLAIEYVNTTNQHLFLTGKAGTGKTTFLKYIKENCYKKLIVAAPTGVAAMNAGGVTLHSLFYLPIGSFIPEDTPTTAGHEEFFNKKSLLKHLRLNKAKRNLISELELLVIDEVSMLRADLLDAIDTILRSVRRVQDLPFGGVQVLFIGDLFQLPPVVKTNEWQILRKFYETPAFHHAKVLVDHPPIYLELKNIYRQKDEEFIRILNSIRNDELTNDDLELLNQHYQPDFKPEKEGEYITLTTHNSKADVINSEQLQKLTGELHSFKAEIKGDFNENTVTAELDLKLKEGAQVMFIRNDKNEKPRYYNGKIGIVKSISGDAITVTFPESDIEIEVEKEIWENKRYKLNKETDVLEEDVKGTFTQYPIRLAWSITIHKSQGLTFEKAIIDAGASFAAGQVYVALSRLTSLAGLVLYSRISDSAVHTDQSAINFSNQEKEPEVLKQQLDLSRVVFIRDLIIKAFEWRKLTWSIKSFIQDMEDKRIPEKEIAISLIKKVWNSTTEQQNTVQKFIPQLNGLLENASNDNYEQLNERIVAAVNYFDNTLNADVFEPLNQHYQSMKVKSGVKKYVRELHELISMVKHKRFHLAEIVELTNGLSSREELPVIMNRIIQKRKAEQQKDENELKDTIKKKAKGESQNLSLEMYQNGKSTDEIAQIRSLSPSTVEGHLVSFVGTKLELNQLVDDVKITQITTVIESLKEVSLSTVKSKLGDEFSYADIRAVLTDRKVKQN